MGIRLFIRSYGMRAGHVLQGSIKAEALQYPGLRSVSAWGDVPAVVVDDADPFGAASMHGAPVT
jgi:hypothetical protein